MCFTFGDFAKSSARNPYGHALTLDQGAKLDPVYTKWYIRACRDQVKKGQKDVKAKRESEAAIYVEKNARHLFAIERWLQDNPID